MPVQSPSRSSKNSSEPAPADARDMDPIAIEVDVWPIVWLVGSIALVAIGVAATILIVVYARSMP